MSAWITIALLVISNIFMTFAWYGHLKLQDAKIITSNTPLYVVILISWGIALFEYICQVPANRFGFHGNGGHFSLMQLKVNSGGDNACGIYCIYRGVLPRRDLALESLRSLCLPHHCRLPRLHGITTHYEITTLH